jgi:phosphoglycerate kinase
MGGKMPELAKLQNCELKGKIVLLRVDHNVVKKGKIIDHYRIDASLDTIRHILEKGGKPILMTHVGRPKDKKIGMITISDSTSVEPIIPYLNLKLKKNFVLAFDNNPQIDKDQIFSYLNDNSIDGLYLPNTRWFEGEEAKDKRADDFARQLAELADIFVNDAFGSWQPHASTYHITRYLPSFAGLLMQKEIIHLQDVLVPQRPFVAVVAGSKFDTKIGPLKALLASADYLILGGVIYNAYLCAKYDIRIEGIEEEEIASARSFLQLSKEQAHKIIELPAIIESDQLDQNDNTRIILQKDLVSQKQFKYILDAAPQSFTEERIKAVFAEAKTVFVNAVMGLTPLFAAGSQALYSLIDANPTAKKFYGGGDTLQDFKKFLPDTYEKALQDENYYFFTGGGTILKVIEEKTPYGLQIVQALMQK